MDQVKEEPTKLDFEPTTSDTQQPPVLGTLFDSISYSRNEDIPTWLEKMNINDAIFALISAAAYGHKKSIYNLLESEIVSKAIRLITLKKDNPNTDPPLHEPN